MLKLIFKALGLAAIVGCLLLTACATPTSEKFCRFTNLSQLNEGEEADDERGKCQAEGAAKEHLKKHPLVLSRSGEGIKSIEPHSYHKGADRLTFLVTPNLEKVFYAEMYVLSVPSGRVNVRLVCLIDTDSYERYARWWIWWRDPCENDPKAIDAKSFKYPEKKAPVTVDERLWYAATVGDMDSLAAVIESGVDLKSDRSVFQFTTLAGLGRYRPVEVMLKHGMDANAIDSRSGQSALHHATGYANNTPDVSPGSGEPSDRKRVVEVLISFGANVNLANKWGVTPLHDVKSTTMAKILIANGANANAAAIDGRVPLIFAAGRDIGLVRLLIASGAEVNRTMSNGRSALGEAVNSRKPEVVDFLIKKGADVNILDRDGRSLLEQTMGTEGDPKTKGEIVALLVAAGARLNPRPRDGRTELHYAVTGANKEAVEALLKAGAKINALDHYGDSPLHWVVSKNRLDTAQVLIQNGADINIKNSRGLPLIQSLAIERKYDLLDIFLKNGANVSLTDSDGETLLFKLVKTQEISVVANKNFSQTHMIQRVIKAGANVNARNMRGQTPLQIATDPSIVELLLSNGALANGTTTRGRAD